MPVKPTSEESDYLLFRLSGAHTELKMTAKSKAGTLGYFHEVHAPFLLTETSVDSVQLKQSGHISNSLVIVVHENNRKTTHSYPLGTTDPFHVETALNLGMAPADIALKPSAVNGYLAEQGADAAAMTMYQSLGMSTEDTAQTIRQLQKSESSQEEGQASKDFLADLDMNVFSQENEQGMGYGI